MCADPLPESPGQVPALDHTGAAQVNDRLVGLCNRCSTDRIVENFTQVKRVSIAYSVWIIQKIVYDNGSWFAAEIGNHR